MNTVRIPLTHGKCALIDEDDFERVSAFTDWRAVRNTGSWHVYRTEPTDRGSQYPKIIYLHRFVAGDVPPGCRVRHINRNRLDNRRDNLLVTKRRRANTPEPRPPIRKEDGTVLIPLTKGMFAVIDAEDEPLVHNLFWHASASGRGEKFYARASLRGPAKGIQMHRFILNAPTGIPVDHIDGDTLNNRRSNIRLATFTLNNANRVINTERLLPKGVTRSRSGRLIALIGLNNDIFKIGTFDTAEEAGRAYDEAALRLFGEFARLNFPDEHN